MLIECKECEALVDGKVIATHESYNPKQDPSPFRAFLLECPKCQEPILAGHFPDQDSSLFRLWPPPDKNLSYEVPASVRKSVEEAQRCFRAGAFLACAVMCGRSLEAICRHMGTKSQYLGGGLKELRDRSIIDSRLFEWSEALQASRNAAAHASDETITKQDAEDLLDFATAICEYVYVLTVKFKSFQKRRHAVEDPTKSSS